MNRTPPRRLHRTLPIALASLTLIAPLAASCSRGGSSQGNAARARPQASQVDPALSADAARALATVFRNSGADPTVEGAHVRADGHAIACRVVVGSVNEEPDHTVAALQVTLEVDAQQSDAFRVTTVAIDANRDEAIQRAIREWSIAYATPVVDALRASAQTGPQGAAVAPSPSGVIDGGDARPRRPPPIPLGPFSVFPGPRGVRGDSPPEWGPATPEFHGRYLRPVEPALDELIPPPTRPGYHSFKILLHVRNGAAGEGECLVDARPSPRLCDILRRAEWPAGDADFFWRQYYVLAPRTP